MLPDHAVGAQPVSLEYHGATTPARGNSIPSTGYEDGALEMSGDDLFLWKICSKTWLQDRTVVGCHACPKQAARGHATRSAWTPCHTKHFAITLCHHHLPPYSHKQQWNVKRNIALLFERRFTSKAVSPDPFYRNWHLKTVFLQKKQLSMSVKNYCFGMFACRSGYQFIFIYNFKVFIYFHVY